MVLIEYSKLCFCLVWLAVLVAILLFLLNVKSCIDVFLQSIIMILSYKNSYLLVFLMVIV